jgi:hypothetical protein
VIPWLVPCQSSPSPSWIRCLYLRRGLPRNRCTTRWRHNWELFVRNICYLSWNFLKRANYVRYLQKVVIFFTT